MNTVATLSNDKRFTSFTYNGTRIRFAAPICLDRYTKIRLQTQPQQVQLFAEYTPYTIIDLFSQY